MRLANIALALALLASGCKAKDSDILAQVCRKTGQKLGALADNASAPLASRFRDAPGQTTLAGRVDNRIRWDRYLAKLEVEVETTAAGTVTLRGNVPDLSIKQRILDLAKSTTGVQQVEDHLALPGGK